MKKIAILGLLGVFGASANAVILYDNLNQTPNTINGSWEGGFSDFGANGGVQIGQRVTSVAGGDRITRVVGEFVHLADPNVPEVLVQVFDLSGMNVGNIVGEQIVTPNVSYLGSHPVDPNFRKTNIEANVDIGNLVNGSDYLVVLQPRSENWGWLARQTDVTNTNTFSRDYSRFGGQGAYGHEDWREMGADGWGAGNANLLVEAAPVPEPTTLTLMGLGISALASRRHRR